MLTVWIVLLLICAIGGAYLSAQRAVMERQESLPTVGGYKLWAVTEDAGYPEGALLMVKPGGPYIRGNTLLLRKEEGTPRYLPVRLTGLKDGGAQGETLTGEAVTFEPGEIVGRIEVCAPGMGRVYTFLSSWVILPVIGSVLAASLLLALLIRTLRRGKRETASPADSMDLFAGGEPAIGRGKPVLAFPQPPAGPRPSGTPQPVTPQPAEAPYPATPRPAETPYPTPPRPAETPYPATPQPAETPYPAGPRPSGTPQPATPRPAEVPSPAAPRPDEAPCPTPPQPAETPEPAMPQPMYGAPPSQEAAVAIYRGKGGSFAPDYLHTGDSLEAFKAFLAKREPAEEILIRLDPPAQPPKKRDHPASHRWRGVYRKRESFYERYARSEEPISLSADEIIRLHQKDYAEQKFRPAFIAVVEEELHKEEPGGSFHNRNERD